MISGESGHEVKKKKILKYVVANPGVSKEGVVRGMKGDPSRLTVLNMLDELKDECMIDLRTDKPNSQIYRIYPNENNLIVTISNELEEFETAFVKLLEKSKERIKKKDFSQIAKELDIPDPSPFNWTESDKLRFLQYESDKHKQMLNKDKEVQLILEKRLADLEKFKLDIESGKIKLQKPIDIFDSVKKDIKKEIYALKSDANLPKEIQNHDIVFLMQQPIVIFRILTNAYSCRSIIIWPQQTNDKETLKKLYSNVFTKIADIQSHLTKFLLFFINLFWNNNILTKFMVNTYFDDKIGVLINDGVFMSNVLRGNYELFDMHKEIEQVLNSLIKITKENRLYIHNQVGPDLTNEAIDLIR